VIECGAFKHLSYTLISLNLSNNSIKAIEPGTFKCLNKLKTLNLSGNELSMKQLDELKVNAEIPPATVDLDQIN
jgi:Leucine-rich repeat (LRR) protein